MEKIYYYRFNEKTGLSCYEKFVKECKKYYKVANSSSFTDDNHARELKVVENNFMSDYYILEKSDINKVLCSNFVYLTERDDKKALSLILENYEDKLNVSKENFEIHKNILETAINAIKKELEKTMSAIDLTLYYYLKQHLKVVYKTTNNDETYIRCKFCGDSKKDSRRARLYISNKPPFKFHCFNCEMSGVVDDKFLDFFINDGSYYDISKYIREKKNEYLSTKNLTYDKNIYNHPYFKKDIDYSYTRKKDENKLKYLSERLGENITLDDIEKFKIVLNIQDYFKFNNLKLSDRFTNDREKKLFLNLRDNYIGFLSTDRNNIIFRNINPNCEKKYRFYNLKVFNDEDIESKKNYNIGGTIDIYHEKHTIIMAEGPIDIISIYKKYYTDKDNSYIFLANGGKGYSNSLQFLSDLTLLDNDIIIYSDSDVEIDFYRRLKEYSPMLKNNRVTLQYNKKSKDFGTTKDNIELANKIIL